MLWILYIILEAFAQYFFLIKRGITPVYWPIRIARAGLAVLYGAFILDTQEDTIWRWFGQVILPFAFVFNFTLNRLRKKGLFYVGENSGFIEPLIFKFQLQVHYFFFTLALFVIDIIFFIRY